MKFLDLFAGIGGFRMALEQEGHQCVGFVEWDKFARQSYKAIYNTKGEYEGHDIQEVKGSELPRADVWTFGSPCQNISLAGNRKGLKGEQSSMFFEVIRLLEEVAEQEKPKYLIMENVKNLLSSNRGWDFARVIFEMDKVGYDVEWNVFNSADFVPQNRERIYIVGHLRGASTRKVFPISRKNEQTNKTDESRTVSKTREIKRVFDARQSGEYGSNDILNPEGISTTLNTMSGGNREPKIVELAKVNPNRHSSENNSVLNIQGQSHTVTARAFKDPGKIAVPTLTPDRINKRQNGRRFKENGDPEFTLTSQDRHGVLVREATKKGYAVAEPGDSINISQPNSKTRRGRVGKQRANTPLTGDEQAVVLPKEEFGRLGKQAAETFNKEQPEYGDTIDPYNKRIRTDGKTNTVTTRPEGLKTAILPVTHDLRIRKLTPLECWRLQGFPDWAFYKAQNDGLSNSQLYKQAGNSVTVPVVRAIAEKL